MQGSVWPPIRNSTGCKDQSDHLEGTAQSPDWNASNRDRDLSLKWIQYRSGSRIFPRGVRQFPEWDYFPIFLPKTAWKWKNLDPQGDVPGAPLDPPMQYPFGKGIRIWFRVSGNMFYIYCDSSYSRVLYSQRTLGHPRLCPRRRTRILPLCLRLRTASASQFPVKWYQYVILWTNILSLGVGCYGYLPVIFWTCF